MLSCASDGLPLSFAPHPIHSSPIHPFMPSRPLVFPPSLSLYSTHTDAFASLTNDFAHLPLCSNLTLTTLSTLHHADTSFNTPSCTIQPAVHHPLHGLATPLVSLVHSMHLHPSHQPPHAFALCVSMHFCLLHNPSHALYPPTTPCTPTHVKRRCAFCMSPPWRKVTWAQRSPPMWSTSLRMRHQGSGSPASSSASPG